MRSGFLKLDPKLDPVRVFGSAMGAPSLPSGRGVRNVRFSTEREPSGRRSGRVGPLAMAGRNRRCGPPLWRAGHCGARALSQTGRSRDCARALSARASGVKLHRRVRVQTPPSGRTRKPVSALAQPDRDERCVANPLVGRFQPGREKRSSDMLCQADNESPAFRALEPR